MDQALAFLSRNQNIENRSMLFMQCFFFCFSVRSSTLLFYGKPLDTRLWLMINIAENLGQILAIRGPARKNVILHGWKRPWGHCYYKHKQFLKKRQDGFWARGRGSGLAVYQEPCFWGRCETNCVGQMATALHLLISGWREIMFVLEISSQGASRPSARCWRTLRSSCPTAGIPSQGGTALPWMM